MYMLILLEIFYTKEVFAHHLRARVAQSLLSGFVFYLSETLVILSNNFG